MRSIDHTPVFSLQAAHVAAGFDIDNSVIINVDSLIDAAARKRPAPLEELVGTTSANVSEDLQMDRLGNVHRIVVPMGMTFKVNL